MIVARTIHEYLLQRLVFSRQGVCRSTFSESGKSAKGLAVSSNGERMGRSAGGEYDSIDNTEY